MKHYFLIKICLLFIVCLFLKTPIALSAELTPEEFVRNFYILYWKNELIETGSKDYSVIREYISPSTLEQLNISMVQRALPDGVDYFIKAQDFFDEWFEQLIVHKAVYLPNDVIMVPITFGVPISFKDNKPSSLLVFLQKKNNTLSIIKITDTEQYKIWNQETNIQNTKPINNKQTPEEFVRSFYLWYFHNDQGASLPENNKEIYNYVASNTIERIRKELSANFHYTRYLIRVADYSRDWEDNILTYPSIALPDGTILVPVSFDKDRSITLVVVLVYGENGLRITKIEDTWGYSAEKW